MIGPGLIKTTALSFLIHVFFFLLILVMANKNLPNHFTPSYTVMLLAPAEPDEPKAETAEGLPGIAPAGVSLKNSPAPVPVKKAKPAEENLRQYADKKIGTLKKEKEEKQYIDDRISAMKAKQNLKQKSKALRSIDVGTHIVQKTGQKTMPSFLDSYYTKVSESIWQEWVYPSGGGGLEAVVSVTIKKDGTLVINGFEKSSGNSHFDRSALKAINKASPLEPPPMEMEIGIRFFI